MHPVSHDGIEAQVFLMRTKDDHIDKGSEQL
jgi:hypothetical protein